MKVTVDRHSLASSFSLAASVAPAKSNKEVLNNVKFVAEGGVLWLVATDLENGIRVPVPAAQVELPGAALLSTSRMGAILREWSEDEISIEVDEGCVIVSGAYSRFELPTADPMEFPSIRESDEKASTTFAASALSAAIKRTSFAVDPTSNRYALGGVLLVMDGKDSSIVATDGRRLARAAVPGKVQGKVSATGPIVPTKAAMVVAKLIEGAEEVKVRFGLNECWFETDRGMFWCRLLEGRYPKWEQVIPKFEDWTVDCMVPAGPLGSLIRQAAIVADSETRGVDFTIGSGILRAGAKAAELGQSQVHMPIAHDGDTVVVKLDYRFLNDFLRVLDATTLIRCRIKSSTTPVLLTTDDGYEYVVMPMALDA